MQTHIGIPADNHGLRSLCDSHGIVLEAYSPLAHGKALGVAAVQTVAAAHNKSTAEIALRFVAQLGKGLSSSISPLGLAPLVTSSSNPKHLAEDLTVFTGGWALSDADMVTLQAVTKPSCALEAPGSCCH